MLFGVDRLEQDPMRMGAAMTSLRILLVDDEIGDRQLVKLALMEQHFHCNVEEAASVESALATIRGNAGNFDLILLDGHMDGRDTTIVIDTAKQCHGPNAPRIVVLTGSSNQAAHAKFTHHGAETVLEKPTDFLDLVAMMASLPDYIHAA